MSLRRLWCKLHCGEIGRTLQAPFRHLWDPQSRLGNVWRYPYITGQYGGAVFILLYIYSSLYRLRPCRGRPVDDPPWVLTDWSGIVGAFTILSYYAVVGGWVLHYVYLSLINSFAGKSAEQITNIFHQHECQSLAANLLARHFYARHDCHHVQRSIERPRSR